MRNERKNRTLLTTLIVLTITAIAVASFVLAWDVFDFSGKLTALLNTDFYASNEALCRSDTMVDLSSPESSGLPEAEYTVLKNYFICYFASLGSFYHENISRFFSSQCEDKLMDEMALDYEISAARTSPADYSFQECAVRLTVLSRRSMEREKPGTVCLTVQCSAEIPYGFSEQPVRTYGEEHTFLLTTEGKECRITGHATDRPARAAAENALTAVLSEAGYTKEDLSYSYFPPYIEKAAALLSAELESFRARVPASFQEEQAALFEAEYEYDREAAAECAQDSPHSEQYGNYEENDVNFCSQCLIAGGIPMDAQGDRLTQWKWYGYEENNAREHSGCTRSWFDRDCFWTYALENTGFGLVAQEAAYGETGSVIQLMNGETPVLQAIITGTVSDKNGDPADYLICTDQMKNIPLSLVRAGNFRILRILGYNTANI